MNLIESIDVSVYTIPSLTGSNSNLTQINPWLNDTKPRWGLVVEQPPVVQVSVSIRNHGHTLKYGRSINSLQASVAQKGNQVRGMLMIHIATSFVSRVKVVEKLQLSFSSNIGLLVSNRYHPILPV